MSKRSKNSSVISVTSSESSRSLSRSRRKQNQLSANALNILKKPNFTNNEQAVASIKSNIVENNHFNHDKPASKQKYLIRPDNDIITTRSVFEIVLKQKQGLSSGDTNVINNKQRDSKMGKEAANSLVINRQSENSSLNKNMCQLGGKDESLSGSSTGQVCGKSESALLGIKKKVHMLGTTPQSEEEKESDLSGMVILSQEQFLQSSQDEDNQSEVQWKCQSPETVQRLKKLRGQYSIEAIKKIVENFTDIHVKTKSPSHRPGVFLPTRELPATHNGRCQKVKERVPKKFPMRFQSRETVNEMITLLQSIAAKQRDNHDQCKRTCSEAKSSTNCEKRKDSHSAKSLSSCDEDYCWSDDDLFKDNSFLIEATQNPEHYLNTSHDLAVMVRRAGNNFTSRQSVTGEINTLDKKSMTLYLSNTEKDGINASTSLFDDSNVVSSSCIREHSYRNTSSCLLKLGHNSTSSLCGNTKPIDKLQTRHASVPHTDKVGAKMIGIAKTSRNLTHSATHFKEANSLTSFCPTNSDSSITGCSKSSNAFGTKCGFAYTSKCTASVDQNSHSSVPKSSPTAVVKSSLRKFNSFSEQQNNYFHSKNQNPTFGLKTSFKRTLSFDISSPPSKLAEKIDISTFQNKGTKSNVICTTLNTITNEEEVNSPCIHSSISLRQLKSNTAGNQHKKVSSKPGMNNILHRESTAQNDGFDISLPEDVVQQLLEPDDILDSQSSIAKSRSSLEQVLLKNCVKKCSLDNETIQNCTVCTDQTSRNLNSNISIAKSISDRISEPISRPAHLVKATDTPLSLVQPIQESGKLHRSNKSSVTLQKMKSPFSIKALKQRRSFGLCSSTPVKHAKCDAGKNVVTSVDSTQGTKCTDSFVEDAFNDSFMTDTALFESQILPFLDKVESETVTASASKSAPDLMASPVKCSPEEIEQKRQAALQRRSLRLSQTNKGGGAI